MTSAKTSSPKDNLSKEKVNSYQLKDKTEFKRQFILYKIRVRYYN